MDSAHRDHSDYTKWKETMMKKNDSFGNITVPYEAVTVLNVTILEGFEIKRNSILNLVDKPNPQIEMKYPIAEGRTKFLTSAKLDTVNPVWNETFTFVLPSDHAIKEDITKEHIKFSLIVEDWHDENDYIAMEYFDPSCVKVGEEIKETIEFDQRGRITIKVGKEIRKSPDIRFSLKLCDQEMEYRLKRIPKVMKSLNNLLGEDGPQDLFETPVMSVIGSGGGIRAMTGMCGVMEALEETGLLDCMTYVFGTSGSAWYLSTAYTREALTSSKQRDYHDWLRSSLNSPVFQELISLSNAFKFSDWRKEKKRCGQCVTLVDYFGMCISERILGKSYESSKLSDLRKYVETAEVPFPVFATQQAHDAVDIWTYHADCNLTPFECEIPQHGINVDMKLFDSEFYGGILTRKLPEPNISYIQGAVGSAFSIRLNGTLQMKDANEQDFLETLRDKMENVSDIESGKEQLLRPVVDWLKNLPAFMNRNFFVDRTAEILNIARGLSETKWFATNPLQTPTSDEKDDPGNIEGLSTSSEKISLVDAGILCNVATDPALRPQRGNDVLFVFNFNKKSGRAADFTLLKKVMTLAEEGNTKFPPVDFEKLKLETLKEFYIFEDENDPECPIVFWFSASTEKFKNLNRYKPRNLERVESHLKKTESFTDFDVIGNKAYSTFKSEYTDLEFERLRELMWFNVIINTEKIKRKIHEKVIQKRNYIAQNAKELISL